MKNICFDVRSGAISYEPHSLLKRNNHRTYSWALIKFYFQKMSSKVGKTKEQADEKKEKQTITAQKGSENKNDTQVVFT